MDVCGVWVCELAPRAQPGQAFSLHLACGKPIFNDLNHFCKVLRQKQLKQPHGTLPLPASACPTQEVLEYDTSHSPPHIRVHAHPPAHTAPGLIESVPVLSWCRCAYTGQRCNRNSKKIGFQLMLHAQSLPSSNGKMEKHYFTL